MLSLTRRRVVQEEVGGVSSLIFRVVSRFGKWSFQVVPVGPFKQTAPSQPLIRKFWSCLSTFLSVSSGGSETVSEFQLVP